jgi:DNA polymerase III gamma/tau subunit
MYEMIHRPTTLDKFRGNSVTKKTIQEIFDEAAESRPRYFIIHGPNGCGKYSLARIMFSVLGTHLYEIDGAFQRKWKDLHEFAPTRIEASQNPSHFYIIVNPEKMEKRLQQVLSNNLKNGLIKGFCVLVTENISCLVPDIRSSSITLGVSRLQPNDLFDLLQDIVQQEKIETDNETLTSIVQNSQGVPETAVKKLITACLMKEERAVMEIYGEDSVQYFDLILRKDADLPASIENLNKFILYTKVVLAGRKQYIKLLRNIDAAKELIHAQKLDAFRANRLTFEAEIKLGHILRETPLRGRGGGDTRSSTASDTRSLKDFGLNKKTSHEVQLFASQENMVHEILDNAEDQDETPSDSQMRIMILERLRGYSPERQKTETEKEYQRGFRDGREKGYWEGYHARELEEAEGVKKMKVR